MAVQLRARRYVLAAQVNGTRTAVRMADGPGLYRLRSFRVQRTAGANVNTFTPRVYEASAGTDIDTLAYQHLTAWGAAALATYPQDTLNAAMPDGGRYVATDANGDIWVDANQGGGSVDTFRWVLYLERVG